MYDLTIDEWYRASIFSLHGGSLLQLVATQSLFWSFPLEKQKEDYSIHNVVVYPANKFGECCFAPLVTSSTPQFRIKKINNIYSVRLNANICGCCGIRECTPFELNDVWSVSANGKIITATFTSPIKTNTESTNTESTSTLMGSRIVYNLVFSLILYLLCKNGFLW